MIEFLLGILLQPQTYTIQNPYSGVLVAEARERDPETIEEHTRRVAREIGIPEQTLVNLVQAESLMGERMEGDNGDSCGLVHINKNYFPEEHKRCYDNDFSLRFAANFIKKGDEYLFTSCNCYQYVKAVLEQKIPRMEDIEPNSSPFVGAIAIFMYGNTKHLGVVTSMSEKGFTVREANKEACKTGEAFYAWDDKNLKGFATP